MGVVVVGGVGVDGSVSGSGGCGVERVGGGECRRGCVGGRGVVIVVIVVCE